MSRSHFSVKSVANLEAETQVFMATSRWLSATVSQPFALFLSWLRFKNLFFLSLENVDSQPYASQDIIATVTKYGCQALWGCNTPRWSSFFAFLQMLLPNTTNFPPKSLEPTWHLL